MILLCKHFCHCCQQGRFTLLLGPPGSGKSTLLKALSGKLEKNLAQVLKLASRWGALLLMDEADGWTELRTSLGEPVTRTAKGKYLMYWPIRVLSSDSPDAP